MVVIYTVTLFVSAVLLFLVQPMFTLMVLPLLGGSPAVWNTAVVFYQFVLLLGYLYAHVIHSRVVLSLQMALHSLVLLLPFLFLPIGIDGQEEPPLDANPTSWLLKLLATTVGLPFFVVSITSPLLQSWFAHTRHSGARDPYFLYVASNAGSMGALLGYPIMLQPQFSLPTQSSLWAVGYGVFVVLMLVCVVGAWRSWSYRDKREGGIFSASEMSQDISCDIHSIIVHLSVSRRGYWMLLAFVPASLMLSVTTYLSTNIATVPLLWVGPLALYLLTFMWAFSPVSMPPFQLLVRLLSVLLPTMILLFDLTSAGLIWGLLCLHLVTFFTVALLCHGRLAQDRPPAAQLTEFYLWLSVGGVLGGVFNALLAPLIFDSVWEYPLILIFAYVIISWAEIDGDSHERRLDVQLPLILGGGVIAVIAGEHFLGGSVGTVGLSAVLGLWLLVCFAFSRRPLRFALGLTVLCGASSLFARTQQPLLAIERSFFGVSRVVFDPSHTYHLLMHGSTIHGRQSLDPARRQEPLSYYSRSGPIGQLFATFDGYLAQKHIAAVGLGAGSLACYSAPGQQWTFYEIDPTVVRLARDPRYFTFLRDCGSGAQIVLGDARVSLKKATDGQYSLIVLDAYSSDAIPVHLITREALALYLTKLAPQGLLAFHISNQFFDLRPVLGNLAHDTGLLAMVQADYSITEEEAQRGKYSSTWVVLARRSEDLTPLMSNQRWQVLSSYSELRIWTDDFSNVLSVLR